MGKGDLRSRRGKIYNGSHGKKRPGRVKKAAPVTRTNAGPARSAASRAEATRRLLSGVLRMSRTSLRPHVTPRLTGASSARPTALR